MFVLGFAGCIGALRENTTLLKFFSVFLGLIFFLELTAGILAFVFKDWIKDQLNFFINNNVKAYRDDIDLQNLIDFAQEYWSCCGAHGPNDWNLNIYFNCTDSNPSRERCGVPFSCCVKDPAEDVPNTQCGYDVRMKLVRLVPCWGGNSHGVVVADILLTQHYSVAEWEPFSLFLGFYILLFENLMLHFLLSFILK
ncbi:hypothetical protein FKM82_012388 [Ascaphus truei]